LRLRRVLAVICAIAFLAVGFAHAFDNVEGLGAGSAFVSVNSSPETPAGKTTPAVPCDHCYGCTGAMAPVAQIASVGAALETDFAWALAFELDGHGPVLNTPPPKALI
jgi:hypothetical protein